jgi:hypothetical protein
MPIGGDPGINPRSEINEYVNAAAHVNDESDGGRRPLTTIKVKIPTDVIAVIINNKIIPTNNLVEFDRVVVNTVEEKPFVNSLTAVSNDSSSAPPL